MKKGYAGFLNVSKERRKKMDPVKQQGETCKSSALLIKPKLLLKLITCNRKFI
jgi:hypothetical protein